MVIEPTSGLCNYLRVVFSYYSYCIKNNETLVVIWLKTSACPGYFLDYFKPLDNVIFEKNNDKNYKIDYKGSSCLENFFPIYEKLVLLEDLKLVIKNKQELLGNYIAIHVRRTDHIKLAKLRNSYTDDSEFFEFIDKKRGNNNIYVATDNEETYNLLKCKYMEYIKFDYHTTVDALRKTSLKDAIIDLFMCVDSSEFMGSGWSSFSDTIKEIRKLKIKK